jgi:hypothetical protein
MFIEAPIGFLPSPSGAAWNKASIVPVAAIMPPRWGWKGIFLGGVFYKHAAPTGAALKDFP